MCTARVHVRVSNAGASVGVGADGVSTALPGSTHVAGRQLLTVLTTTYARSDPPQLGRALEAIRDAKEAALVRAYGV